MTDMTRTKTNDEGDVCTLVVKDDKYTLFTFDADTNRAYIETLVKLPGVTIWAYMVVGDGGRPFTSTRSNNDAVTTIEAWQDLQGYVDALRWPF